MRLVGPDPRVTQDATTKAYVDAGDAAVRGYVDAALAPRVEPIVVDFGPGGDETTVYASGFADWVRADSVIVCVPAPAGTADHGAEDAALEGVSMTVTYIEAQIGFDVLAVCPGGTWGRYLFHCIG